jgi:hypothetical protein
MAEGLLGGQGLGKSAILIDGAAPAQAGADADLAGGAGGLAGDQLAADGGQAAKNGVAQAVAQELAAAGAGIGRTSAHVSAVLVNMRYLEETGSTYFAQALTFLGLFSVFCWMGALASSLRLWFARLCLTLTRLFFLRFIREVYERWPRALGVTGSTASVSCP